MRNHSALSDTRSVFSPPCPCQPAKIITSGEDGHDNESSRECDLAFQNMRIKYLQYGVRAATGSTDSLKDISISRTTLGSEIQPLLFPTIPELVDSMGSPRSFYVAYHSFLVSSSSYKSPAEVEEMMGRLIRVVRWGY